MATPELKLLVLHTYLNNASQQISNNYRRPWVKWLAENVPNFAIAICTPKPEQEPRVWELDGFNVTYVPSVEFPFAFRGDRMGWSTALWGTLRRLKPTMIITLGYNRSEFIQSWLYAKLHRIPLILFSESHAKSSIVKGGFIAGLKHAFVRSYDRVVTIGKLSTEQIMNFGVPRDAISEGLGIVDADAFRYVYEALPAEARERQKDKCRFLYLGRLIARKGVMELLEAFRYLPKEQTELSIAGFGPLEEKVRAYIQQHNMTNVLLEGPVMSTGELVRHYAKADIFVMPSTTHLTAEVWGLVVNEALICGCQVLVGEDSGCAPELVTNAPLPTGVAFNAENAAVFKSVLAEVFANYKAIDHKAIAAWGQSLTPDKLGKAFVDAMDKVAR